MIAIGGAKGVVGKSLFVGNLGVLLFQPVKRTVLEELDLGDANLHYSRKLKLLRVLKTLVADFMILDLGVRHHR